MRKMKMVYVDVNGMSGGQFIYWMQQYNGARNARSRQTVAATNTPISSAAPRKDPVTLTFRNSQYSGCCSF